MKKTLLKIDWSIRKFIAKIKNPRAGQYEIMCLAAHYPKKDIDTWVQEAIKKGDDKFSTNIREDLCESEVSCWE